MKRVREEEEEQGNGAMDAREGVRSEEDFATTRAHSLSLIHIFVRSAPKECLKSKDFAKYVME